MLLFSDLLMNKSVVKERKVKEESFINDINMRREEKQARLQSLARFRPVP